MLQATYRREGDITVIDLAGSATEALAGPIPEVMAVLRRGDRKVVINMAAVSYVNSAGLSSFIDTFRQALRHDAQVVFCNLVPNVLKVFKLARVEIFFAVFENETQALQHFGVTRSAHTPGPPPRENILVIEKSLPIDEQLRKTFQDNKETANYKITPAPTIEEALNWLKTKPFHLVILDASFNYSEVEEFLKQLRTDHQMAKIPVIVAAGDSKLADADYFIRNGADDILRHPFNRFEASARVRNAITLLYALRKEDSNVDRLRSRSASGAGTYTSLR
ncbi:MAG TPA: STAS domain-containing protein [bacterium]|nr:STAS domain-containing protein [bacterium]